MGISSLMEGRKTRGYLTSGHTFDPALGPLRQKTRAKYAAHRNLPETIKGQS